MYRYPMELTSSTFSEKSSSHKFKYKIGDKFVDSKDRDTVEITGYNELLGTYKGIITLNFGKRFKRIESDIIYEKRLDTLIKVYKSKDKKERFTYRIYYFEDETTKKAKTYDVKLSNIRALARLLNSWRKINQKRKITFVSVIDENGIYISNVKFLRREIEQQQFLTGMKERLLAHAKYECGYEIATNF